MSNISMFPWQTFEAFDYLLMDREGKRFSPVLDTGKSGREDEGCRREEWNRQTEQMDGVFAASGAGRSASRSTDPSISYFFIFSHTDDINHGQ